MDLIESQLGRDALEKSMQPKLPPPPPKSPLPPPQPPLPIRPDHVDLKRKIEQKGKEVVDAGRFHLAQEDETQRAIKQQRISHTSQRRVERGGNQPFGSKAWLPAPMLNGEPLREDASIRSFNGGIGCQVASSLKEALLLSNDMAELQNIRRNEVFLNLKRYLGMVLCCPPFFFFNLFIILLTLFFQAIQATFRAKEITNSCYQQLDDERKRGVTAVQLFKIAEQSIKDLRKELAEEEKAKKSADAALEGVERQAEEQRQLLREAKDQLAYSQQ